MNETPDIIVHVTDGTEAAIGDKVNDGMSGLGKFVACVDVRNALHLLIHAEPGRVGRIEHVQLIRRLFNDVLGTTIAWEDRDNLGPIPKECRPFSRGGGVFSVQHGEEGLTVLSGFESKRMTFALGSDRPADPAEQERLLEETKKRVKEMAERVRRQ